MRFTSNGWEEVGFNHKKWKEVDTAILAVSISLKLVTSTKEQPLLSKTREIALDEIQKCAETFASFELVNNISDSRQEALHEAFYAWLWTCVQLVRC